MLVGLQLSVFLMLLQGFTIHRVQGICSVETCTSRTTCVLSQDHRSCKCTTGYYGDHCEKNAQIRVMCGRNYIGIMVKEDFFHYHNVPLELVHSPNKSCGVQRAVVNSVPYYISRVSKEEYVTCGGKTLEKNYTHISYSLSLLSDPQVIGNIIRNSVIKMDYTCSYPYIRRVSLPFPVFPFSSEMVMHMDALDATIQMMLYTDRSYSKAFSNAPTIELGDKVYVEVRGTQPADYFLLRLDECWATASPQPNISDGLFHPLLLNGCVKDQTVFFLDMSEGQSGHNGESSTIRYSFDMFRFTAEPSELYLHCTVQLCEPDDHESCIPNCNSIRKRAVRVDPTQDLLSYGPIRIKIPDRPYFSTLAAAILPVVAVWTVAFFLILLITVAKAGRRLRHKEEN